MLEKIGESGGVRCGRGSVQILLVTMKVNKSLK